MRTRCVAALAESRFGLRQRVSSTLSCPFRIVPRSVRKNNRDANAELEQIYTGHEGDQFTLRPGVSVRIEAPGDVPDD